MRKKLHNIILGRLLPAAAFTIVIVAIAGCESDSTASKPQPTPKEAATAQWNDARAAVLGGLADDQFKTAQFREEPIHRR